MKILIVDDEPLVRIGIKSAVPWELNGIEIIGEASDGEEAVRLMIERKPDIVMLDIQMPKMDGIEVLLEMKKKGIKTKSIILSSFDDFVIVKKAMQLGALDYFHKPGMNVNELLDVLKKVQSGLEPHQDMLIERGFGKKDVLHNMLHGKIPEANATKLKESGLYVVLFSIRQYKQVLRRYPENNITLLPNTIINILSELVAKEKEIEFTQIDTNLFNVTISNSTSKSEQASFTYINKIIQLIHASLKRYVNIDTVFGVSQAFHSFAQLKTAYSQAKDALAKKFYHPEQPVLYYLHETNQNESNLEQASNYIQEMKAGLKEENCEQFTTNLATWEQCLRETECMNEQDVRKIYEFLLFMLDSNEEYAEHRIKAEEAEDFHALASLYHPIFDEKLIVQHADESKEYSLIIRNIIQYIDTNYNQDISLRMLGEHFQISSNYISRLFNQEVGRGVVDYLNEIRIENAKQLLKSYKYKIYEIAEMVGFKSNVHFAIVFNKYVGMSPKEYRRANG